MNFLDRADRYVGKLVAYPEHRMGAVDKPRHVGWRGARRSAVYPFWLRR